MILAKAHEANFRFDTPRAEVAGFSTIEADYLREFLRVQIQIILTAFLVSIPITYLTTTTRACSHRFLRDRLITFLSLLLLSITLFTSASLIEVSRPVIVLLWSLIIWRWGERRWLEGIQT